MRNHDENRMFSNTVCKLLQSEEGLWHDVIKRYGHNKGGFQKGEWTCNCPDFLFRHQSCKHKCKSSNIVKNGKRNNVSGIIQRYLSHDCNYRFIVNVGFEHSRKNPKIICAAIDLSIRYDVRDITNYVKFTLKNIAPTAKETIYIDRQKSGRGDEWEIEVQCSINNIKEKSYNADIMVTDYPCSYNEKRYKIKFSIYVHKCFIKNKLNPKTTVESIYLHGFSPLGLTYITLGEIERDLNKQIKSSWTK